MANGYTALYGSAFEKVERQLLADGYVCAFACTYGEPAGPVPKDLGRTGKEGGWEMRRKLKDWSSKHGVREYKIVRNTSYVRDLHGDVYELWVKRSEIDVIDAIVRTASN
ncbi:TPA: hypothetical protein ACK3Q6_004081 [Burkholderia cepacia]|jgi:hypothetical protein|uniref:Uncharacterized protein n=3 Tax=Burkholderia cepacia complex TaxID=87882 RepID=A0A250LKP0_9BURK|nr:MULTISPECIES: hypothetical protein [Burkholderia]KKL36497.1 hypothetical protein WR31_25285 [Burkholderia contaminans LMG 23361]MBA9831094.1 hypothetical protein [Burkholderia contaminans]MBA9839153.1 hypothetical protein [Burkholderia contaminans]MBA9864464.1 hypothetical protein [Burkholderia contaminans]MBA9906734.1 hypothetical protein [Burkholderia contaminans]